MTVADNRRVALAVERFSRRAGGAESYAVDLAHSFLDRGWEVHLFGHDWDGLPEGAVFHPLPRPAAWLPAWVKLLRFAADHRRAVMEAGFGRDRGVILGFGNTTRLNVYQSHGGVHRLSTARKIPSESSALGRGLKRLGLVFSIKHRVRNYIESAPFRLSPRPAIIAIADMIKDDMIAEFGLDQTEVEVVYNGIDPGRFAAPALQPLRGKFRAKLGLGEDEVVFLFVSYDLKKKGLLPLARATAKLKAEGHDRFRVVVVGGRPQGGLAARIAKLDLADRLILAGLTDSPEEAYADGDALVLPTYYDACSLVVIEAMAAGLPPITTQANGAAGLIEPGRTGLVLPHPPRADDLAEAMAQLLDDQTRQDMGAAAAQAVAGQTLARAQGRLIDICERVVAGQAGNQ